MAQKGAPAKTPPPLRRPTIGVIFVSMLDDYDGYVWNGIESLAKELDVNLVSFSIGTLKPDHINYRYRDLLDIAASPLIDGFIICAAPFTTSISVRIMRESFRGLFAKPCVTIGIAFPGTPAVMIDNAAGIAELLEHLIRDHGFRKIGIIRGPSTNPEYKVRFDAYRRALAGHSIRFNQELVFTGNFFLSRRFLEKQHLLDAYKQKLRFMDALVCSDDDMAMYIIDEIRALGIRVPEQLAVIGFDDTEKGRDFIPALTTVRQSPAEMGEMALQLVLGLLRGDEVPRRMLLPTRTIIRRSCGCPYYAGEPREYAATVPAASRRTGSRRPKASSVMTLRDEFTRLFLEKVPPAKSEEWADRLGRAIAEGLTGAPPKKLASSGPRTGFSPGLRTGFSPGLRTGFSPCVLVSELEKAVLEGLSLDVHPSAWKEAVQLLFTRSAPSRCTAAQARRIDAVRRNAFMMIEDLAIRDSRRRMYDFTAELYNQHYIRLALAECITMEALQKTFTKVLPRAGIPSCYVAIYTSPSRKKAKLFAAYDMGTPFRLNQESAEFRSTDFAPAGVPLLERRKSLCALSLFFKYTPLGFIMFESKPLQTDWYLHEGIATQLSIALYSIRLMDKIRGHNIQLKKTVDERTRDLRSVNEQLKELDKLKNEFIANITHDFRSPLTIILNAADLALKFNRSLDDQATELFSMIFQSSFRLKKTVDRLLELARIDAKGIRPKIFQINPVVQLKTLIEYYRSSLTATGIKITEELPDHPIENFYTDPEKLEEILDNILSNAVKVVDPASGIIGISLTQTENTVVFRISDNGIGIPKEKLESIFNRFERAHEGRGNPYRGTGIGLAFARQLTCLLKGEICAQSDGEGRGAAFILTLKKGKAHFDEKELVAEPPIAPRRDDARALIRAELEEKLHRDELQTVFTDLNRDKEADYRKGIILIAEDDRNIRRIIVNYLENHGFKNFILAPNGRTALDAVYRHSPDIIICDYNMPGLPGDVLHNEIAGNPQHAEVPLVFLSALADENLMLERMERGAAAYLKKPIEGKMLVVTVEEQLKKYFTLKKIRMLASVDEITGLYNQRSIMEHLKRELSIRFYRDFSILSCDIDGFNGINNRFGHQAGDAVLFGVGKTIGETVRGHDIAGRHGGDGFLILLPDTSLERAHRAAELLCENIAANKYPGYPGGQAVLQATVSCGIASLRDHAEEIRSRSGVKDLEALYAVPDGEKADWPEIEKQKARVAEIMLQMALEALRQAQKTACRSCGFTPMDRDVFSPGRCPQCGSGELVRGGNRIVAFGE